MFIERDSPCIRRNIFCILLLISVWIIGLFVGIHLYDPMYYSLMCSVLLQPVTIVGLLMILFLPLISAYLSFLLHEPIISLIVCFFKAVAFGFTGCFISHKFGSGSWLMRLLFLFSDHCCVIMLFILWFCVFSSFGGRREKFDSVFFLPAVPIALLDYFVISPFLRGLF